MRGAAGLAASMMLWAGAASADEPTWRGRGESSGAPSAAFDPGVPASITTMALGGGVGVLALATMPDDTVTSEVCGLSGCASIERPVGDGHSWNVPVAVGGATTAAGGLALFLAGAVDPATHADAGRARVAAGGMVLSMGAGFGVAGLTAKAMGDEGDDASAMVAMGLVTSVVAAPFVVWGATTWDEERGESYASTRRIVGGSILTGVGVVSTTGAVVLMAGAADSTGSASIFPGLYAFPLLAVGAAGLGVGLPLLVGGSDVVDEGDALPDLAVGPTSVQATWRLR